MSVKKTFDCSVLFFSSRRRHTRFKCDWSSDVCSSDLAGRPHPKGSSWRTAARSPLATCQIGRASCRERVEISGVAVSFKKKKKRRRKQVQVGLDEHAGAHRQDGPSTV